MATFKMDCVKVTIEDSDRKPGRVRCTIEVPDHRDGSIRATYVVRGPIKKVAAA